MKTIVKKKSRRAGSLITCVFHGQGGGGREMIKEKDIGEERVILRIRKRARKRRLLRSVVHARVLRASKFLVIKP